MGFRGSSVRITPSRPAPRGTSRSITCSFFNAFPTARRKYAPRPPTRRARAPHLVICALTTNLFHLVCVSIKKAAVTADAKVNRRSGKFEMRSANARRRGGGDLPLPSIAAPQHRALAPSLASSSRQVKEARIFTFRSRLARATEGREGRLGNRDQNRPRSRTSRRGPTLSP